MATSARRFASASKNPISASVCSCALYNCCSRASCSGLCAAAAAAAAAPLAGDGERDEPCDDEHGGLARVELVGDVEQRELEAPLRARLRVGVAAHADHVRGVDRMQVRREAGDLELAQHLRNRIVERNDEQPVRKSISESGAPDR